MPVFVPRLSLESERPTLTLRSASRAMKPNIQAHARMHVHSSCPPLLGGGWGFRYKRRQNGMRTTHTGRGDTTHTHTQRNMSYKKYMIYMPRA